MDFAFDNGLCIETRQRKGGSTVVKQAGIEEIGRLAAGFGGEFAELQDVLFECEFEEILAEIRHIGLSFGADKHNRNNYKGSASQITDKKALTGCLAERCRYVQQIGLPGLGGHD